MNMRCSPFHVHIRATLVAALNRQTFIKWLSMVCFMSHLPFLIESILLSAGHFQAEEFRRIFPWLSPCCPIILRAWWFTVLPWGIPASPAALEGTAGNSRIMELFFPAGRRWSKMAGFQKSMGKLIGGDWNHGILNDFPWRVGNGMSSSQLTNSLTPSFFRGVGTTTNQLFDGVIVGIS